jgi:hypothetical protein
VTFAHNFAASMADAAFTGAVVGESWTDGKQHHRTDHR